MVADEKIPNQERSTIKLQEHMEKAMEQVRKDHYFTFCKHLLVYDLALGSSFLKEIQVHYVMNVELEMFMSKKLQMLTYSCGFLKQTLS
jgi:hypothetical protein